MRRIRDYIAADSPLYAHVFVDRLTGSVTRLRDFPNSGRVVPEFGLEHIREVIVANYRIVYRVRGNTVEVATVFHASACRTSNNRMCTQKTRRRGEARRLSLRLRVSA